jgi:hypothetical protein
MAIVWTKKELYVVYTCSHPLSQNQPKARIINLVQHLPRLLRQLPAAADHRQPVRLVLSDFSSHSLIPVPDILSGILGGALKVPTAQLMNV